MTKTINFKFDFLFWFLILAPTFYIAGSDTRTTQLEFFKVAVIAMVAFFHVNRFIGVFLGYLVFQFIFFNDMAAVSTVIPNVFFAAVLYDFIVRYAKVSKKHIWALYGVLLLSVLWIPIQMAQLDPVWSVANSNIPNVFTEYAGWFSLPAFLGNYAAVVLPLAFLLHPALIGFSVIALFFSKSTFSVIAALAGCLFFLWFKKRIYFWIVLAVFGLAGSFYVIKYDMPTGQFSRRLNVWNLVLKESFQNQFFGHGIGAYGSRYRFIEFRPSMENRMVINNFQLLNFLEDETRSGGEIEFADTISNIDANKFNPEVAFGIKTVLQSKGMDFEEWMPAHNEFLQLFFDVGLLGLLIVGAYIFDLFKRFRLYATNELSLALMASFVAILVVSFAHFPFQIARLAVPFIVILAFLDMSLMRKNEL